LNLGQELIHKSLFYVSLATFLPARTVSQLHPCIAELCDLSGHL